MWYFVSIITFWLFVCGLYAIISRVGFGFAGLLYWLLLCGGVVALVSAVVLAFLKTPTRGSLTNVFDSSNRCGGLLMAGCETDIGSWEGKVKFVREPRIKLRSFRSLRLFFISVVFFTACGFVPARDAGTVGSGRLNIDKDITELKEQMEVLEEENIIDEEKAANLEIELSKLEKDSEGSDPVKTWQGLDHLKESMEKYADEGLKRSLGQAEELSRAQGLGEALRDGDELLDEETLFEAMRELNSMVGKLSEESEFLKGQLSEELLEALNSGKLSREQLERLLKAIKDGKVKNFESLGRLVDAKLVDAKYLSLCEKLGECNSEGLAAFLAENCDKMSVGECMVMCGSRGGISRGRGDAAMTWSDGTDVSGAEFEEQVLPQASLDALRDSEKIGASLSVPEIEDALDAGTGGKIGGDQSGAGGAVKHRILPKHKEAVKQYFGSDD